MLGTGSGVVGLYVSPHADIASGPAVLLANAVLFLVVYLATRPRASRAAVASGAAHG